MDAAELAAFLNPSLVLALLVLALFLTLYLERARLRRRAAAARIRPTGTAERRVAALFFWAEVTATFLLLTLLFGTGAVGIRLLVLGAYRLFGAPWFGLLFGVAVIAALVAILMLESEP